MAGDDDKPLPAGAAGTPAPGTGEATAAPRRRWLKRALAALAILLVLLAGGAWLLGRESTLQQIVARVAAAMAIAQVLACIVAVFLFAADHEKGPIAILSAILVLVWSVSALLFRLAARQETARAQ